MKVTLLNNILPKNVNQMIINELTNHHWFIAWDKVKNRSEKIFSNKNSGFSVITFDNGKIEVNTVLNVYGQVIYNIIVEKLKINAKLDRIFWNMYLKESESELHTDRTDSNFFSVVYNLHTTDGGTEINNKIYPDLESQAKIFKSNLIHRGIGPKQNNVRFNLNLIFKV
jgi:hypothetical protein